MASPQSPPVLVLVLDTLRSDFLFDPKLRERLPNLSRLMSRSLVFSRAYSPSHWTLPAHASLFTGLIPSEHRATPPGMGLREDVPTLAELFREAGYETIAVSCNGFISDAFGTARGFSQKCSFASGGAPPRVVSLLPRRSPERTPSGLTSRLVESLAGVVKSSPRKDNGARQAIRCIRSLTLGGDRSPFLFVNLMEAHNPYRGRGSFRSWAQRARWPRIFGRFEDTVFEAMSRRWPLSPEEVVALREIYWESAAYLDAEVGDLVAALPASFLREGFVIVASDHGEMLGESGDVDHVSGLREPLIHIPLFIRPPGGTSETAVDVPVSLARVFFLLRGVAREGSSALASWLGSLSQPGFVVAEAHGGVVPYVHRLDRGFGADNTLWRNDRLTFHSLHDQPALACVTSDWKLVCHLGRTADELFNLRHDRHEECNMAAQQSDILRELHERLRERFAGAGIADHGLPLASRRDLLPLEAKRAISETVLLEAIERGHQPAILWTGGKDSTLILYLALAALRRTGKDIPPAILVDHAQHFRETLAFVREVAAKEGVQLLLARNDAVLAHATPGVGTIPLSELDPEDQEEALKAGLEGQAVPLSLNTPVGNHLLKTVALNRTIRAGGFDRIITGIRWDENPARASEVFFSPREDPPHVRVHPILPWTEREVWTYTRDRNLPVHPLYSKGYRSLDGIHDSMPTDSRPAWEQDLEGTKERAGRAQDKEHIMERLRALGYF